MDSVQKKNVEFSPVHRRCLQTKYCLWVLENYCAFDAVMSLCRGMVGGSERSSYRHALTQQSSQGSPGQIKHTPESRHYVESGSSIESNINKSIECVAIRFTQHSVAKALKHHLDASDTEVSTCRNAVYWRTLKPCNLAVTVQKETLLDFHPAFIITMWAGYANQQY